MIAVVTDPHWGDLVALAALVVVTAMLIYLGCRLIDLAIDAMRRPDTVSRRFHDAQRLVDTGRDIAPEDEPSWPHKVTLDVEPIDDNPARYATGRPIAAPGPALVHEGGCSPVLPLHGVLPPEPAETSQPRHAKPDPDDPTAHMTPVVDGEAAMAAVAAVSGPDGAA